MLLAVLGAIGMSGGFSTAYAQALEGGYAPSRAGPISFPREILAGVNIPSGESPVSSENVLAGDLQVKRSVLFHGDDLRVVIFESTPAKTAHRKPFPIDEFVYLLSGSLILTESDGTRYEFTAGDALVVPKGFAGTWEMRGNYREIAVVKPQPYSFD